MPVDQFNHPSNNPTSGQGTATTPVSQLTPDQYVATIIGAATATAMLAASKTAPTIASVQAALPSATKNFGQAYSTAIQAYTATPACSAVVTNSIIVGAAAVETFSPATKLLFAAGTGSSATLEQFVCAAGAARALATPQAATTQPSESVWGEVGLKASQVSIELIIHVANHAMAPAAAGTLAGPAFAILFAAMDLSLIGVKDPPPVTNSTDDDSSDDDSTDDSTQTGGTTGGSTQSSSTQSSSTQSSSTQNSTQDSQDSNTDDGNTDQTSTAQSTGGQDTGTQSTDGTQGSEDGDSEDGGEGDDGGTGGGSKTDPLTPDQGEDGGGSGDEPGGTGGKGPDGGESGGTEAGKVR
jgi:hypothetical protein